MDERLLAAVNGSDGGAVRVVLGGADRTAYPVYYGALPAAWTAVAVGAYDSDDALDLTMGMVGAYAAAVGLKRLVRRERPISAHKWVVGRPQYPGGSDLDPYSWPSGHATLAAVVSTTLALNHRDWRVVAPGVVWAGAVGTSRVWLGVHYPSDVVTGWLIGTGTAYLVHRLRNNGSSDSLGDGPLMRIVIPLG